MSPDIMFLMETKNEDSFIKEKLRDLNYPHYFSVPPMGLSGGLSLMWKDGVEVSVLESSPNLIDTTVTFKGSLTFISFIYGAPAAENRASFWAKLHEVGRGRDSPWLIACDFNDILNNAEKSGGPTRWEGSFTAFRSFVSQKRLWDLRHSGNPLSWGGTRYTHFIRSRLDRAMVNCSWNELYPMGRCKYLRFEGSDHRPVMTFFNKPRPRKRGMFRFNRSLTEKEEVEALVEETWNQSPLASVIAKLDACRRNTILWSKEQNTRRNLLIHQNQEALDLALSSDLPDHDSIARLTKTLQAAYKEEELFWLQRSRIQWLKSGDRNTGFFHAATRQRRLINTLSVLEDDKGREVFEDNQICAVIAGYFNNIFKSNGNEDFEKLKDVLPRKITDEMNQNLVLIPSDSEIKKAAFSINAGKAPGPDGFSAKFYHAYWHIIGPDVIRDIRQFFTSSVLHPQQNETHVRLIPKGSHARKVAEFRPIAL